MLPRILSEDSILTKLPSGLDAVQRNWLEGIRYSIGIIDLAYRRLAMALHELGGDGEGSQSTTPMSVPVTHDFYASVLLDAWTVVDATWRLKRFIVDSRLPSPPGPPVTPPPDYVPRPIKADEFVKAVRPLKQLRDGFQHLDNKVSNMAALRQPVWGYVQWVKLFPHLDHRMHSCCLVPGIPGLGTATFNLINPAGKEFRATIDHVTLTAFEVAADLSHLHRLVGGLAQQLDDTLRPHLAGLPHGGDSYVVQMVMVSPTQPLPDTPEPTAAQSQTSSAPAPPEEA